MPETEEVLNAIKRLFYAYQQRAAEYDSAAIYYNFEMPPRDYSDDREIWLETASILSESSIALESVSKLELLRGRLVADRIELLTSLAVKLGKSLSAQIRTTRNDLELQPASATALSTLDNDRRLAIFEVNKAFTERQLHPDQSLTALKAAVNKLRDVEKSFDSFFSQLQGSKQAVNHKIDRLRNDLHAVNINIAESGRKSDRWGIWSIVFGVVGILVGIAGVVISLR